MRFEVYHERMMRAHGIRLAVLLDGEDITFGCVTADDRTGTVTRYIRERGRPVLIEDRGRVEFRFSEVGAIRG